VLPVLRAAAPRLRLQLDLMIAVIGDGMDEVIQTTSWCCFLVFGRHSTRVPWNVRRVRLVPSAAMFHRLTRLPRHPTWLCLARPLAWDFGCSGPLSRVAVQGEVTWTERAGQMLGVISIVASNIRWESSRCLLVRRELMDGP
jgi:hypothetical protein